MKFISHFLKALFAQILAFISVFFIHLFTAIFFVYLVFSNAQDTFIDHEEVKRYHAFSENEKYLLEIDLSNIVESPINQDENIKQFFDELSGQDDYPVSINLHDLTQTLKRAAKDKKISAISLDLSRGTNMGFAQVAAFHRSLDDFKKSGKKIYAHAESYNQLAYLAASAADSVFVHPMGVIEIKGLAILSLHFKKLLSNLGISVDVWQMGKYKSAVEFLSDEKPSPFSIRAKQELLDDLWGTLSPQLMQKALKTKEELKEIVTKRLTFLPQKAADLGFINGLCDQTQYNKKFSKQYEKINITDYLHTNEMDDNEVDKEKSIALVYLNGSIVDESDDIHTSINRNTLEMLEDIEKNDDISGVVFRINSPGGSALLSDRVWEQIERIKKDKTVAVSMSNFAASGGYYIASGAHRIFTESQTITGSIGVIGVMLSAEEMLYDAGVYNAIVQTHQNAISTEAALVKKISRYTYQQLDELLKDIYDKFLHRVAQGRNLDVNYVHKIGQGRVWSGKKAVELKLADEIGGIDKALSFVAQKEGFTDYKVVSYPKSDVISSLKQVLLTRGIQAFPLLKAGQKISTELSQLGLNIENPSQISVQARMPHLQIQ